MNHPFIDTAKTGLGRRLFLSDKMYHEEPAGAIVMKGETAGLYSQPAKLIMIPAGQLKPAEGEDILPFFYPFVPRN